jgi:two-component system sensor histidine kinase DesK
MRLLPDDPDQSWTRYAWLIYLVSLFVAPFVTPFSRLGWIATLVSVAIFLPLYFWSYWLSGRALLWVSAVSFVLGLALAPFNSFSYTYIIYAGGFLGRVGSNRWILGGLSTLVSALALACWALHYGWVFFMGSAVFMIFVTGINAHFTEVHRAQALLQASRKENERLVQIAERERIARDLHDLLGHTLSVITLKAELAGRLLKSDPARAASEIAEVERTAREAMREVRSAVVGYRSEGLAAELARARIALETAGLRAEYFVVPVQVSPAVESALSLALREAVTNVVRHAGAESCTIALEEMGGLVRLEIRDDGRGGVLAGGTGLLAMQERIASVGGRVELSATERGAKGGTRIVVSVPPRAATADRARDLGAAADPVVRSLEAWAVSHPR